MIQQLRENQAITTTSKKKLDSQIYIKENVTLISTDVSLSFLMSMWMLPPKTLLYCPITIESLSFILLHDPTPEGYIKIANLCTPFIQNHLAPTDRLCVSISHIAKKSPPRVESHDSYSMIYI